MASQLDEGQGQLEGINPLAFIVPIVILAVVVTCGVAVGALSAPPTPRPPVPVFRADHPFLFAICDVRTGLVLFLGREPNLRGSPGRGRAHRWRTNQRAAPHTRNDP